MKPIAGSEFQFDSLIHVVNADIIKMRIGTGVPQTLFLLFLAHAHTVIFYGDFHETGGEVSMKQDLYSAGAVQIRKAMNDRIFHDRLQDAFWESYICSTYSS